MAAPLASDDRKYLAEGRCLCIIINNVNYRRMEIRIGSESDVEALKSVFNESRRCTVQVLNDRTAKQIHEHLKAINHTNSKYKCLFVFFLAHGYQGGIYGVDGGKVSINSIQLHLCKLNCPPFADKPKILTFQSCRDISDPIVGLSGMTEDNFLLAFAAQPYSASYRHTRRGSYYIQCLVHVIKEKGNEEDYISILTIVRREILGPDNQNPIYHSFLIDKVFIKTIIKE